MRKCIKYPLCADSTNPFLFEVLGVRETDLLLLAQ